MVTNSYYVNGAKTICVTLAQAKKQLKVKDSFTVEDELITEDIAAATMAAQNFMGRSIDKRDLIIETSSLEDIAFVFNNDNDAVTKIEYFSPGANSLVTLDSANYKVRTGTTVGTKEIKLNLITGFPIANRDDAVRFTISQGWTTAQVPADIVKAIKLKVTQFYQKREEMPITATDSTFNALLRPYRRY